MHEVVERCHNHIAQIDFDLEQVRHLLNALDAPNIVSVVRWVPLGIPGLRVACFLRFLDDKEGLPFLDGLVVCEFLVLTDDHIEELLDLFVHVRVSLQEAFQSLFVIDVGDELVLGAVEDGLDAGYLVLLDQ